MPWFFWLLIVPLVLSMFAALLSANIRLMAENERLKNQLYKSEVEERFEQVKEDLRDQIAMSRRLDRIWNEPFGDTTMGDRDEKKREEERKKKLQEQWDEENRRRNDISDPSHPLNPLNPLNPISPLNPLNW